MGQSALLTTRLLHLWGRSPADRVKSRNNYIYFESVNVDANRFQQFFPFSNYRATDLLHASTIFGVACNYTELQAFGGEFSFTLGGRNVFAGRPQKEPMSTNMQPYLYAARGRMVCGRIFLRDVNRQISSPIQEKRPSGRFF